MNIKKIISEEIDDFDWIKDVKPKSNNPQPNTAWVILDVPTTKEGSTNLQNHLFNLGFRWPDGSKNIKNYIISSVGTVWKDNIRWRSFTYVGPEEYDREEDEWLTSVKNNTQEIKMDVFLWRNNETVFSHESYV